MSVFHGIRDISVMPSGVFVRLAVRLPAYTGAVAARKAMERRVQQPAARRPGAGRPLYERTSGLANNARTADSAPPATAAAFGALNAQLGQQWFSYRTADGNDPGGGDDA